MLALGITSPDRDPLQIGQKLLMRIQLFLSSDGASRITLEHWLFKLCLFPWEELLVLTWYKRSFEELFGSREMLESIVGKSKRQ